MKILAFDPAKTTGYAFYDTARDHSLIRSGVYQMPEKDSATAGDPRSGDPRSEASSQIISTEKGQ